ncbi:hypothetical protein GRJ2_000330300 [Grus japonensis]|uniref:Uncharacterized protein n=1 Tax=Grus japonensis TaxID=30415 RepID=A0ABC9W0Q9_GRUJA
MAGAAPPYSLVRPPRGLPGSWRGGTESRVPRAGRSCALGLFRGAQPSSGACRRVSCVLADEYKSQHSTRIQDGEGSCSLQWMKKTRESKDACEIEERALPRV